ncbi:MAG: DUF3108 domain-containing protein [Candidatus Omnitrophica bacterium]|nr:DUF3108 domain-containing protein [Candidatus Omnitrophota bacterium]
MRNFFPYLSAPNKRWGRRTRLLFLLFLVIAFFYVWNANNIGEFEDKFTEDIKSSVKEQSIDRIGEKIKYDLFLSGVRVGTAEYHHSRKTYLNKKLVDVITFHTQAMSFKDRETIYCDSSTFLPLVVERKISKPIKPEKIREVYDQENFKLTITNQRFGTSTTEISSTEPIHNSIILPFFVRNAPDLAKGWTFTANLPQGKYRIELMGTEEVETPAGKFEAYYFESDPSKIKIWISTDERRIPLRIDGTGGIGYKMMMHDYGLAGNFNGEEESNR